MTGRLVVFVAVALAGLAACGGSGGVALPGHAGTGAQAGTTGTAGTTGAAGDQGAAGTTGAAGDQGAAGSSSTAGTSGATGTAGTSAPDGGAGAGSGAAGTSSASDAGVDRGPGAPETGCPPAAPPPPAGGTIDLRLPATLAGALATAKAGDRIILHAGTWPKETISKRKFASFVSIEAAAGEAVTMAGATFQSCDHIMIRDVVFSATVMLDGSSNFTFHHVTLDGGATEEAALHLHGQGSAGATHDVLVERSAIKGGGRTIFVLGVFANNDGWNHHLTFVRNTITCGSHNCFQISGGRDMVIDGNDIQGTTTAGVLTAGATRVAITHNRFLGGTGKPPCATQLASPGMEWDNYDGVENMVSSAIVVANNIVSGSWGSAVQLDAAKDIAIVYNTVPDGPGVRFNHRTPHDRKGNVILNGNSDIRVWNNIMQSISVATGETGPSFQSNDIIWKGGGGGAGLITTAPSFANGDQDFRLAPGSVGIDAALVNAETPTDDFEYRPRGAKPDIGAHEQNAPDVICR
jgi:hypothetical protein